MFIDLVDDLRCPRPHEETWLVASSDRTEGRDIVQGTLGCPICRAEYPIRGGVVWFADAPDARPAPPVDSDSAADPELAMRLAAFLDLSDAQGFALLAGSWASLAPLLRGVAPTHLVVLNPAAPLSAGGGISVLHVANYIPLAAATCRGVALDDAHAGPAYLRDAVHVLRPRGRLVAPASTPTPSGATELARDEHLWVAERDAAPPKLVPLTR
ncbi:MAG: hypothetical protein M3303_04125 [Gemmatimonadota bacterium]|nr:hypothetical protein [Gemmatimonadota bacterium]